MGLKRECSYQAYSNSALNTRPLFRPPFKHQTAYQATAQYSLFCRNSNGSIIGMSGIRIPIVCSTANMSQIFSPIVSFANSAKNLFFFNFTFQYFSSAMFLLHMFIKFGQKPKLHLADLAGQVFILIPRSVLQENSNGL